MKWLRIPVSALFALSAWVLFSSPARAQLPVCNTPGLVYFLVGSTIYNYDPYQVVSATNPSVNTISVPGAGLAVSNNLNGAGPSPTFYTVSGNNYWYYNGSTWTNTGHSVGNAGAVNIAGGGSYIYALVGGTGDVYQYDGTGNSTLLTTVTGFNSGGPFDLVADIFGNWYILKLTLAGGAYLRKYDATGTLLQTWNITGSPGTGSGGGFAIICDSIYVQSASGYYKGYVGSSTINLVAASNPVSAGTPGDMASCPAGTGAGTASIDTGYYCGTGPGIPVSVTGNGTASWTVLSGNANIAGSGNSVMITASVTSRILVTISGGQGICSNGNDTVTIVVPTAAISMVPYIDTAFGCGTYLDTLSATVTNTTPGISYNYAWTPAATITGTLSPLSPIVAPATATYYVLTVSTPAAQGGCTWKDSAKVVPKDLSVSADFAFTIRFGCLQDTVVFQNLSPLAPLYEWKFGNNASDTARNTTYIYPVQGLYPVRLLVRNGPCFDTITRLVDTRHPLLASFSASRDTLCQGQSVSFTNTSTWSPAGPARFLWVFGDGSPADTNADPTHLFAKAGVYNVMMVITDFISCKDTAYRTIVVDSVVSISFTASDTSVCEGRHIQFSAATVAGHKGVLWDFGDGSKAYDKLSLVHAFDSSGIYTVSVTGNSRSCPDLIVSKDIEVKPYPVVDLGPDTGLCTNGEPVLLRDYRNFGNPQVRWLWNTGAVTSFIRVVRPGLYTVAADLRGCVTSDSVEVFRDCYINIPNAFSPNNDGINDFFLPRPLDARGLVSFRMTIYNRWGQEIFRTEQLEGRGWDGRFNGIDQPHGVYIYVIDLLLKNKMPEHYQGNITLIR